MPWPHWQQLVALILMICFSPLQDAVQIVLSNIGLLQVMDVGFYVQVEMARQQACPALKPGVVAESRPSRLLTDIGTPRIDWVSLARGMGLKLATRATSCEEFQEQLIAALAQDGPSLIEAVLT